MLCRYRSVYSPFDKTAALLDALYLSDDQVLVLGDRCESMCGFFFFSSRRRHTRLQGDWSSDVCSSDLLAVFRDLVAVVFAPVKQECDGGVDPIGFLLCEGGEILQCGNAQPCNERGNKIGRASCRERV